MVANKQFSCSFSLCIKLKHQLRIRGLASLWYYAQAKLLFASYWTRKPHLELLKSYHQEKVRGYKKRREFCERLSSKRTVISKDREAGVQHRITFNPYSHALDQSLPKGRGKTSFKYPRFDATVEFWRSMSTPLAWKQLLKFRCNRSTKKRKGIYWSACFSECTTQELWKCCCILKKKKKPLSYAAHFLWG